ncbi:MAG: hypothetical protein GVY16_00425 [Planctomycetes bacterium]|jgi:hypothetical protein|nr:hypothetical protein [Planctomycetota bacterium]
MSNLNLLPDYYVKERFRYRIDMICVVLFAIVMAAMIVVGKRTEKDLNEVRKVHERVTSRFEEARDFVEVFFSKQADRNALQKRLASLQDLRQAVGASYILSLLTTSAPSDVSLSRVSIAEPAAVRPNQNNLAPGKGGQTGPPPPPRVPEYMEVTVKGRATDTAPLNVFVQALIANALTDKVSSPYSRLNTHEDETFYEFNFNFRVLTDRKTVNEVRSRSRESDTEARPVAEGSS